jgi:hypothetical protein
MALFGRGLKSCTHTHTKHDIRPRCTKIKQETNDRAIYLLINRCATHIKIKMTVGTHESLDGGCLIHVKLLEDIMSVLSLANEGSIFKLLDLKSKKKNLSFPIINISNLSVMILLNSSQKVE